MAWNRPSEKKVEGRGRQRNGRLKGLVAGAIVVVGTTIAAWWLWPTQERGEGTASTKKDLIKAVKPAVIAKPKTNAVVKANKWANDPRVDPKTGLVAYPPWKPSKYGVITNNGARTQGVIGKCFKNDTDRKLAWIMTVEPGEAIIGASSDESWIFKDFNRRFLEESKEPIEDSDDDTDYMRDLKACVRDFREDIRKRIANGEDVGKLLLDARKDALELAAYRADLEKNVDDLIRDKDMSEEDARELVNCANEMLKGRGAKELALPEAVVRKAQLRLKRQKKGNQNEPL